MSLRVKVLAVTAVQSRKMRKSISESPGMAEDGALGPFQVAAKLRSSEVLPVPDSPWRMIVREVPRSSSSSLLLSMVLTMLNKRERERLVQLKWVHG